LDVARWSGLIDRVWRGKAGEKISDNQSMSGANFKRFEKGKPIIDIAHKWQGWGTALKPAYEPIILARVPLKDTVAANVMAHGTGALNIDGCRIEGQPWQAHDATRLAKVKFFTNGETPVIHKEPHIAGRWPANIIHDGSEEVLQAFPDAPGQLADVSFTAPSENTANVYGRMQREGEASAARRYTDKGGTNFAASPGMRRFDSGSAARFFYCAKASTSERNGSRHPTIKPLALMRWLVRLVTPPGGLVLDPFAGSGTTLQAAVAEGFRAVGIDSDPGAVTDARNRMWLA
jgi:site-specific DNA-methyltransferase (adenine-specific)